MDHDLNMQELADKRALVVGLGASGQAAVELLRRRGAKVMAIDSADTPQLRQDAERLRRSGVAVRLGVKEPPADALDLAVLSPGVPVQSPLVKELARRHIPLMGELEPATSIRSA
jgi:UDP-N-acetylmuramoylalanine--D-glutamate ligase